MYPDNTLFANTLRLIRKHSGYTQTKAAQLLFISRQQYCHYENGLRVPSLEILVRMATLYALNPLELIIPLIPRDVALENPDTAFYLKNGMFIYPDTEKGYSSQSPVSGDMKHTAAFYQHAPSAHPELR